jgi:hypothetical protein
VSPFVWCPFWVDFENYPLRSEVLINSAYVHVYGNERETTLNSHSSISSGTCCVFGPAGHETPEARQRT